ncbi:MAG: VWA domain-containing protein, partial [Deltaproteobacteria bacterium]
ANRGVLYVDEVNLLSDHLVEAILDAAASGHNLVQREGISHSHPARFILVGTMNPEEGELRPQLLDRFGLCVEVHGEPDIELRVRVLERRDQFDRSSLAFFKRFEDREQLLAGRISRAVSILPKVRFPGALNGLVSEICTHHHVAGHRADIVIAQAARALAAYDGRQEVIVDDVRRAAIFAIPHRARDRAASEPLSPDSGDQDKPRRRTMEHHYFDEYPKQKPSRPSKPDSIRDEMISKPTQRPIERTEYPETIFDIGPTFTVRDLGQRRDRLFRNQTGTRYRTQTRRKKGRYVRSTCRRLANDIAFDATLRAAAPYQVERRSRKDLLVTIRDEDIREKVRESRTANFLLFIVDASGSMGAKGRMTASKGAIMSLLKDAYQKRDRVAMVTFRKQEAVVNLPPTSSIYRAGELLEELPVGGKTPLAAGLRKGLQLVTNSLIKDPACRPIVIVITDGKANESIGKGDPFWEALDLARTIAADKRVTSIVVDAEETDGFRFGLSERLADVLKAEYFRIKDLKADVLLRIARSGM